MQGRILAGRFRLIELLGQGGMGSVWRAHHLELDTDVAVKLMDPSLTTVGEGLARFRREAQAAASLKSPNVVQVFDYGVDGDTPYIAMELLQGESLAKRLERLGRLPLTATARILSQVARAVGKAHDAGIVHRDLKPENIYLVVDEDVEITKVLDFGIAKRTGADNCLTGAVQTQTGAMLGTPFYMSPEQAGGKKDIDHRTDIWSFGVIAFECLTGRRMFNADSLGGLVLAICAEPIALPSESCSVPHGFDEWFSRCVNRERQARFETIREAASALEALGRMATDGLSPRSTVSSARQVAPATTAPDQGRATSGLMSGTQAGPMSVTLSDVGRSNRSRKLVLGTVVGVIMIGSTLVFWSKRLPSVASPSIMSSSVSTGDAVRSPLRSVSSPVLAPAAAPTPITHPDPQAAVGASSASSAPFTTLPSKRRTRSAAVKNQSGPIPPMTPSSVPPRPTQPTTSVDLAF